MNGETFLIYTTEQGGTFKTRKCSEKEYRHLVSAKNIGDFPEKFYALVRVEDNFDVVLGCSRDDEAGVLRHCLREARGEQPVPA